MALDRNRQYDVLNYCPSAVSITTRDFCELVPGGNSQNPARLPLKLDDIIFINTKSRVFQDGILFFDPEEQAAIYEELRIRGWENILTDQDIEQMILHPSLEALEQIIGITDVMLFERIYGVYVGLKNAGSSITLNVQTVMDRRHSEITNKRFKTEIRLRPDRASGSEVDSLKQQMAAQAEELGKLKAMLSALNGEADGTEAGGATVKKPATRKKKTAAADTTTAATEATG